MLVSPPATLSSSLFLHLSFVCLLFCCLFSSVSFFIYLFYSFYELLFSLLISYSSDSLFVPFPLIEIEINKMA